MIIWDSKENLPTKKNIYLWNEYSELKNIKSILRYIEKNSELIRSKYINFIYDLGNKKFNNKSIINYLELENNFSYWWFTLLAEKSFYKQENISHVLKLIALEEIVKLNKTQSIQLVSPDNNLHQSIKEFCAKKGIDYSLKKNLILKKFSISEKFSIKKLIKKRLLKEIQALLIFLKYIFLRKNFFKKVKINYQHGNKSCFVMSYFTYFDYKEILRGKFISNYWNGLYKVIDSLKLNVNWLQIFIPHSRTKNSKEANILINQIKRKKNQTYFFLENYLNYTVIFLVIKKWFFLVFKYYQLIGLKKLFTPKNSSMTLWYFLRDDWKESLCGPTSINNLFLIILFDKFFNDIPKQKKGFYLCENISSERALNFYWKKYHHGKLIGIQHSTFRFWDLRNHCSKQFFNKQNKNCPPEPDFFALNGSESYKGFIKIGYPKNKLLKLEALRYQHLIKRKAKKIRKKKKFTIFVAGDYSKSTSIALLELLNNAVAKLKYRFKMIYKAHPMTPINLTRYKNLKLNKTEKPISNYIKYIDLALVSNPSSASVDFLLSGTKVLVMLEQGKVNFNPLKGNKMIEFFYDKNSLQNSLEKALKSKPLPLKNSNYFYQHKKLFKWKKILQ